MLKRILHKLIQVSTVSPYQEAIYRYRQMERHGLRVYQDISPVETAFPTIDLYLQELEKGLRCLDDGTEVLYRPYQAIDSHLLMKSEFFLTSTGHYLDVAQYHERFIDLAVRFLARYEEKENNLNKSGLLQANLHRLTPVVNNLFTLSEALNPI